MKKFIFLLLSLLLPIAVMAAYTDGTINIMAGGTNYAAPVQIDNEEHVVILGNGRNACVPHYIEGVVIIPGTQVINGIDYRVDIGNFAFRLCNSITQVTVGEGTENIGDCAFVGCSKLEKVTLPSTLFFVGRGAFANLKSLKYMVCNSVYAPHWKYNDVFNFYGTKHSMMDDAKKRILYVPAQSTINYQNSKYGDVGWKDAFTRIYERTGNEVIAINSKAELKTFRDKVNDGTALEYYNSATTFELTADIEWDYDTDGEWIPIGTIDHPFDGSFDGKGHKISELKNTNQYGVNPETNKPYIGLFGYASNAYIHNFHLINPRFISSDYAGAVLGYASNYTRVSDVLVTSNAGNQQYTIYSRGSGGGIVGFVKNGVVERCYFQGRVWSYNGWAGGIVGHIQNGTVEDCGAGSYVANIKTSDNWRLGGIVGGTYGSYTPGQYNVIINRCLSWSNFIIDGSYSQSIKTDYSGWILGYANVPTKIINCAFYADPWKTDYKIYGGSIGNVNVLCDHNANYGSSSTFITLNSLMGRNTAEYLKDDNWYYFTEGYEDYPIPFNLKDMYYVNTVYVTDDNGIVYMPIHNENKEIVSYKVKGYVGTATSLTIPNTYNEKQVTEILPHALEDNTTITETLTIGKNITAIGDSAFMGAKFNKLVIGENGYNNGNLKTIGISAFENCDNLEIVLLPDSVNTIRKRAFRNCDNLWLFSLGKNFAHHEDNFLAFCPELLNIYINTNQNPDFTVVNNYKLLIHNVGNTSYVIACAGSFAGDLVLPVDELNNEIVIYDNAFVGCDNLTSITLPNRSSDAILKKYSIGNSAFTGCNNLRYLDMRGVTSIDNNPWKVERNDPSNPFYGMNERTIIWTDETTTCEESEPNVIRGNQANSILLTDGWDFEPKVEFIASSASLDRKLEANMSINEYFDEDNNLVTCNHYDYTGFSVYLPYPLTLTADNVKVYEPRKIFDEGDNSIISFYEVENGEMEAYKPYYVVVSIDGVSLNNDSEVTIKLLPTDGEDWTDLGYIFSGTTVTIPNSTLRTMGAYILQQDNAWHKVPADKELENVYVGPFRAYFHTAASNSAPASLLLSQLVDNGSVTTEVEAIRTVDSNGDERYFDLQGRQLPGKPEKGFYIHNGKKYIAK